MSCEACKSGFQWNGTTTGQDATLNNDKCYVTGDSKDVAILFLTDIYGYTLPNARLLADHYVKEANATVYVPDLFEGEFVHPDTLRDPERSKNFNITEFLARHNIEARWPKIKAFAQTLKAQYPKVGAVGFCYGAWGSFHLAREPALIDVISVAHPALVTKEDYDAVKVPVQILAPEHDHAYTEELKLYTAQALPKTGVAWAYVFFPGMAHGFACRGDPEDEAAKKALERAKRHTVNWINEFSY